MAVTVLIPTTLRLFTNNCSEIKLEGKTVGEVIGVLSDEYPETKKALFDEDELDPTVDTVFICKEGKRSILAVNTLREAGYTGKMFNLKDGTNAWARDVAPSFPKY